MFVWGLRCPHVAALGIILGHYLAGVPRRAGRGAPPRLAVLPAAALLPRLRHVACPPALVLDVADARRRLRRADILQVVHERILPTTGVATQGCTVGGSADPDLEMLVVNVCLLPQPELAAAGKARRAVVERLADAAGRLAGAVVVLGPVAAHRVQVLAAHVVRGAVHLLDGEGAHEQCLRRVHRGQLGGGRLRGVRRGGLGRALLLLPRARPGPRLPPRRDLGCGRGRLGGGLGLVDLGSQLLLLVLDVRDFEVVEHHGVRALAGVVHHAGALLVGALPVEPQHPVVTPVAGHRCHTGRERLGELGHPLVVSDGHGQWARAVALRELDLHGAQDPLAVGGERHSDLERPGCVDALGARSILILGPIARTGPRVTTAEAGANAAVVLGPVKRGVPRVDVCLLDVNLRT
mmetsp:Transcript_775/g.1923  ORF Transcript_775/g.1923 Transcript_775/m.1923 type:complete len:408 (+) Transcript_775:352-1575(+)